MLAEILLGSLADLLRLKGGDLESSMGRKSLIVNLAALAGRTGHSGRDHVRRVFERWASKTQHQGGSGEVSTQGADGRYPKVEAKVGTFGQGGIFLYRPMYLILPIMKRLKKGIQLDSFAGVTQDGVGEVVTVESSKAIPPVGRVDPMEACNW